MSRPTKRRRVLLATSSFAALALCLGSGTAEACLISNPPTPFTNNSPSDCITLNDSNTHSGDIVNNSTLNVPNGTSPVFTEGSYTGISILNAGTTLAGNVTNNGSIIGAIERAINVGGGLAGAAVNGSVVNNGLISGSGLGILIAGNLGGSVINNNTINTGFSGIQVTETTLHALAVTVGGSVINNGSITVVHPAANPNLTAIGIDVYNATILGSVINNGSVTMTGQTAMGVAGMANVVGSMINNGTITVTGANLGGFAFSEGMLVANGATINGAVENTSKGSITVTDYGILLINTISSAAGTPVVGSILNSGSITSTGTGFAGIALAGGIVSNDITNAAGGTIRADHGAGILLSNATTSVTNTGPSTIQGRIVNQGSIIAQTGIVVAGGSVIAAGIFNSGSIAGSVSAIDLTGEGAPTTLNQMAGSISGNILLSALGDTVNITGGTISGDIVGQASTGTVNFALGAGSFTYANTISGVGAVNVNSGTVHLTGTNTYTGTTDVNGGILDVQGSIASSSLTTVDGGTLMGTGAVGSTTVANGGTLAPGDQANPIGVLTITGSLAFQSAATYMVTISGANSSSASVTGPASLAGTVQAEFASSPTAKSYDILQSGGLGGTRFGSVVAPNYSATLTYSATDVFLNITGAALGNTSNLNQNQQAVATAISTYTNSVGTLPPGFANLFDLTGAPLANSLSELDGEDATGAERGAFDLMNEFLELLLDPFTDGQGGFSAGGQPPGFAPDQQSGLPPDIALAYAGVLKAPPAPTFRQRWTTWAAGFGGTAMTNGDPAVGSNNVTTSTYGYAAGLDYHYSPDTVLGFSLAGGGTNWNLAQGLGSGRSDAFLAGVRAVTREGPLYLAGVLAFANNWFATNRTALGDQLAATFQGQGYAARFEGGYRFAVPVYGNAVGVTPYGAIQAQDFHTPAYSETDLTGGGFGLSYSAMNGTDARSELGGRFDDFTAVNAMPLVLRAKLAWAHDWVSNPALNASFESLPGTAFTVNGAPIPRDSAVSSAGAQLYFAPNWSVIAKLEGEFAPGSQTYAGSATLRHTW